VESGIYSRLLAVQEGKAISKRMFVSVDQQPSAPIHFVLAALSGVVKTGGDIRPLLDEANIPLNLINEPKTRVSSRQFSQLVHKVTEQLEDEFLGLTDKKAPLGTFELMAFGAIHCSNLQEAMIRACRFYTLMVGSPNFELNVRNDKAYLTLAVSTEVRQTHQFVVEAVFTAVHRFICWLVDKKVEIHEAGFHYPAPIHEQEYPLLFGKEIRFSCAQSYLCFDKEYLSMSIMQNQKTLSDFMRYAPYGFLLPPQFAESVTRRIRHELINVERVSFPTLDVLSDKLHTTPSTLSRRLREENTSYQQIKDAIRRDIAIHHLTTSTIPISEISELLGYQDVSIFHRAFKKWSGVTPGAYRLSPT